MASDDTEHKLEIRNLLSDDYAEVASIMDRVYPGMGGAWTSVEYERLLERFGEGQICIADKGQVIAATMTLLVDHDEFDADHTYEDVIGRRGEFPAHDPDGNYLYGIDVFVDPEFRDMRLGRRLYDARKELCERQGLKGIFVAGRMPGYGAVADQMSPRKYVERVRRGEIVDPVLTFQLSNEFHPRRVLEEYLPDDVASASYAVLLEWINIFHTPRRKAIQWGRKSNLRLGVVQWQMRPLQTLDDVLQQAEFFVDAVAGYQGDLLLFPELFNAPLLARFNQEDPRGAARALAAETRPIRDALLTMAVSYNINVVAGSLPEIEDGKLYNVSYLCRRDGTFARQRKLHVTPDEAQNWGLQGGNDLRAFDTDVGKIGILICYDVEYPELARLLADQGMKVLLVPFLTDTRNAYLRVRRCAQARAIENECYVAISGSVGNLPRVENMDIQYAQTAVFTPSDFAFPHDAIAAEATPNTEMTLITDLDLDLLKQVRKRGSVRNLEDRRRDLYEVVWRGEKPLK